MEIVWARFSGHLAIMLAVFLPGYGKRLFRMRRPTVQIGRSLLMLLSKIVFVTAIARVPLATLRRGDPGAPGARLKRAEILSRETLLGLAADLAEVAAPLIEHSGSSKKNDRLQILTACSAAHRLALPRRFRFTEPISRMLLATGGIWGEMHLARAADGRTRRLRRDAL